MSCGVGLRCCSDPALLWLWCRLAAAAPIRPPSPGTSIYCRCSCEKEKEVPIVVQWKRIRLGNLRLWVRSLALLSGLRIQCCQELWCRITNVAQIWHCCGYDVSQRAIAPIKPLAWEPPYTASVTLKTEDQKKKKKNLLR